MVNLIVGGTYLDMFGDETITLTKRAKDARELNNLFADYSNTFSLPASQTNNKIFKHYYNFNVIGGYDARIKTPARLEIDNYTLQDGLIRLDECVIKNGKVDVYKVTFYGNSVNLADLFGEETLDSLNLSAYDHVKDITNVSTGLSSALSLLSDNVIYPLISKDVKWTSKDLTQTPTYTADVQPAELCPALKVKAIIDTIATDYGLTFTSDFFTEAHFNKLYLWCPRELQAGESAVIDANGNPIPFQDPVGGYTNEIESFTLGILRLTTFNSTGYGVGRNAIVFTPSNLGASYTIKLFGKTNAGAWVSKQEFTSSGVQTFNFTWNDTDNFTHVRWYVESATDMTATYTMDIRYAMTSGSAEVDIIDDPSTGTNSMSVNTYANQMKYKIPSMKIIDFFGGIIKMFNLMITPVSSTEFDIEPYDVWIAEGEVRDLTDRLDFVNANVITPKLPKEVSYRYEEPKAISNNRFNELTGKAYGDAEARTDGGDQSKIVEVKFENLLWEKLTDQANAIQTAWSFEAPGDGFEDKPFLMYWGNNQSVAAGSIILGTGGGSVSIGSYKMCGSYYPSAGTATGGLSPTHSLNFDSEKNSFDYTIETVSLFENYHKEYIEKIFHEAMRVYKVEMHLPTHLLTEIDVKDVIKLDDIYYNINSMTLNLTEEKATFELINFVRVIIDNTTDRYRSTYHWRAFNSS
jgi:hypothetical protein